MKHIISLFIFAASLTAGFSASAQTSYDLLVPKRMVQTAQILGVKNTSDVVMYPEVGTIGSVTIDRRLKQVYVQLFVQDPIDTTFTKIIAQLQLHLDSQHTNSCGSVVYQAHSDRGAKHDDLTIIDNTKNTCLTLIALQPTELRLTRSSRGIVGLTSEVTMHGEAFASQMMAD